MILRGSLHDSIFDLLETEKDKVIDILQTTGAMTLYNHEYNYDFNEARFILEGEYKLAQRDKWGFSVTVDYAAQEVYVELNDDGWAFIEELELQIENEIMRVL